MTKQLLNMHPKKSSKALLDAAADRAFFCLALRNRSPDRQGVLVLRLLHLLMPLQFERKH
jgi:hypothetical protein